MSKHKDRQSFRIIEATMRLIESEGISRINMSKVADAAGMTRQTLYNHFPDVESIIVKALDMHGEAMLEHLTGLMSAADSAHAKLQAFAVFYIESASPEHDTSLLEAGLSAESRDLVSAHERAVFDLLEKTIVDGLKGGEFSKDSDPVILADLVQGLINGGVAAAIRQPAQKSDIVVAVHNVMRAIL